MSKSKQGVSLREIARQWGERDAVEREHILRVLRETRGRIGGPKGAAAKLGLKRTTLQSKLKQFGIDHHSV